MRHFWQTYGLELLLALISFAAALAIRLPNFMLTPRFTDEGLEVLWALDIARGRQLPLTGVDAYYGPLFSYLIAVLLRIFGLNIILPRLMTTIFGALTVAATYGLGRVMWNRRAGLIAACLAATSPDLILGSHMGWSNSLTPLFSTVTVLALYAGVVKQKNGLLVLSGLFAALTLQTHPLSIVALAGMLAWFLLRQDVKDWLKRRATWAALALFLLGYAPMIAANLGPNSPTLNQAENRTYAFAPSLSPVEYAGRFGALLQHIFSMMGGGIEGTMLTFGPLVVVVGCLLLAGLLAAWRGGNGLLAAIFLSSVALLPIFVMTFAGPAERYIAFLDPIGWAAVGGIVAEILSSLGSANPAIATRPGIVRVGAAALASIGLLALVVYPITTISAYYDLASTTGETNQEFFQLSEVLKAAGACGNGIFVLDRPYPGKSRVEAYYTANSIQYVLHLDDCGHLSLRAAEIITHLSERGGQGWLIMPEPFRTTFSKTFDLEPVTAIVAYENATPGPFMLYRVKPLP